MVGGVSVSDAIQRNGTDRWIGGAPLTTSRPRRWEAGLKRLVAKSSATTKQRGDRNFALAFCVAHCHALVAALIKVASHVRFLIPPSTAGSNSPQFPTLMADIPQSRRDSANTARHGAASHIQAASDRKAPIIPIVIGGIVLVAVGVFLLNDPNKASRELGKALESTDAHAISSARGQVGGTALSDSTGVKLGAETTVKVPPGFNAQVHGVLVQGAAQLSVKPITGAKALPFHARARKVDAATNGGVMVVRAYEEDPDVMILAKDGALEIRPNVDEKPTTTLAAGQAMAITKDGKTRIMTQPESDAAFSWVDGTITMNAMPLSAVLPVLTRWYNTQARITDKTLLERPVTAVVKLSSSGDALDAIGKAANVHVAFVGDTLTLADGAPSVANKVPAKVKAKKK